MKTSINWTVFSMVVLMAITTASMTIYDLSVATPDELDGAQSRLELRWGSLHTFSLVVIFFFTAILAKGWKRLYPYNVPFLIILIGLYYVLFFLTFTVGWVGIQGVLGFVIAFLVGSILLISHAIYNRIERRKTNIKG